jgi:hypothetical protein
MAPSFVWYVQTNARNCWSETFLKVKVVPAGSFDTRTTATSDSVVCTVQRGRPPCALTNGAARTAIATHASQTNRRMGQRFAQTRVGIASILGMTTTGVKNDGRSYASPALA